MVKFICDLVKISLKAQENISKSVNSTKRGQPSQNLNIIFSSIFPDSNMGTMVIYVTVQDWINFCVPNLSYLLKQEKCGRLSQNRNTRFSLNFPGSRKIGTRMTYYARLDKLLCAKFETFLKSVNPTEHSRLSQHLTS